MPFLSSSSSSASSHADALQPCLEPQLPTKPNVHNGTTSTTNTNTTWGSLYTNEASFESTNKTNASATTAKKKTLVSKKNLDICTETLGCETGVFYTADDYKRDDLSLKRSGRSAPLFEAEERKRRARKEMMLEKSGRRVESTAGFPPPLSSISGESRLHLIGKRSNGRFVMFSIKPPVMHAEKSDGCLRLRMVSTCNSGKSGNKEEEEEEVMKATKEVQGTEEQEEGSEMKGMVFKDNVGKEMEVAKYAKIGGRCKEEGEGKSRGNRREKWEAERAFWVATS